MLYISFVPDFKSNMDENIIKRFSRFHLKLTCLGSAMASSENVILINDFSPY